MHMLKLTQIGNSVGVVLPKGYRSNASQAEASITMLAVVTGDITEYAFSDWLRLHAHKKTGQIGQ